MRVSKALLVFTHLIAMVGFLTICVTGQVSVPVIIFFAVSLFISVLSEHSKNKYYLSENLTTVLAVVLVTYVIVSVSLLGEEVFRGILHFLIFTQVIKFLGEKEIRDIVQIFILSFFQFLAGSILTIDLSFGLAFVVYVALAIWGMISLSMRKESLDAGNADDPNVVTPLFLSTTFVVSFCLFIFTALLFVSVPRLRGGFFTSSFIQTEHLRSGFSNEVKLGRVGQIKLDSSPVMRVRILGGSKPISEPVYWRGIALDNFDGSIWRVSDPNMKMHRTNRNGNVQVKKAGNHVLTQEIVTEPLDTDILFAASVPVGFRGISKGRVAEINDSYMLPDKFSPRMKYLAFSNLGAPPADELRNDLKKYPFQIKSLYLQLPTLSGEIEKLAREITNSDRNPYDKALAVKRYLLSNMSYTRTLEDGTKEFPLEDFLFDNRAGHCEYFSTAMAVLLRVAGIPSRVVNGFYGGEWNEHGDFYLVRQSDAHSWVEVFFPDHGWVIFDPTPAGAGGVLPGSFAFITSYVDYLKYRWSKYIVDFSQNDQIRLFSEIRNEWRWQRSKLKSTGNRLKLKLDNKWVFGLGILAVAVWVFLTRPELKSVLSLRRKKPEEKATIIYKKALKLLNQKGFDKPDFMTPEEFAKEILEKGGNDFKVFGDFTKNYLNLRFGDNISEEKIQELEEMFNRFGDEVKDGKCIETRLS